MELYRKKINIGNKVSRRLREKYNEAENEQQNKSQDTYLQKMIKKKNEAQPKNEPLNLSTENIQNVRTSVEDILSNENNKKKAIKYVIQIGKNKNIPNNSVSYDIEPRIDKSESPKRGGKGYIKGYVNSYRNSPNRNIPKGITQPGTNKYIAINEYSNPDVNVPKRNYKTIDQDSSSKKRKYLNQEENPNELEASSLIEDERGGYGKGPDPRVMNRINRVLKDRYEKEVRKPQERRNRNISAMPKLRKRSNQNYSYTFINDDENDDIDELIKTIEELQGANNILKKDNYKKNKEINMLKNELDNIQKELEDKRIEHEQEIEDMFKDNDNEKLKNEYYKLLQDYDNNINDYNELKDNYNQIVDEYNTLKTEKNRLSNDNKNLKNNIQKMKNDYTNLKNEANKAVDDYNSIVDDFNKLDAENKQLRN